VLAIVTGLVVTKWLAAEIVGRAWRFGPADRGLMASLTLPQVAATLAAALVGIPGRQCCGRAVDRRADAEQHPGSGRRDLGAGRGPDRVVPEPPFRRQRRAGPGRSHRRRGGSARPLRIAARPNSEPGIRVRSG